MNFHNITQKNLFESYIAPTPMISRNYSSKANTFTSFAGNSLYLGNMRHFTKKNAPFGQGHLKMPPLEHRTDFCDPLVKIVGGFVGSKSQAGTSNHRGRELSLWDVIVDKIIETMENPEPRQASRKPDANGKKTGKIHKIGGFAMIGVGSFGPETGPNFDCLTTSWYPPSADEVLGEDGFGNIGVFTRDYSPAEDTSPKNSETQEYTYETEIAAFCKDIDRRVEMVKPSSCPKVQLSFNVAQLTPACETASDCSRLVSPDGFQNQPNAQSPCQNCRGYQSKPSCPPSDSRKHVLRPEAAEFTPRMPCHRASSESEDDGAPSDVLSSSCESQPSDTFLRPKVKRTLSECSVDSDDSFIVFESAEDDPVILSEDSEDEDSCSDEDLDEIDNPVLFPHNLEFSQPLPFLSRLEEANKKWAENYSGVNSQTSVSAGKKVKFAEGNDLVKVKHLIAWDFAHRAARIGPWEMYHRDSERFKSRIAALSTVLSPVLAERHRAKIYSERFQT